MRKEEEGDDDDDDDEEYVEDEDEESLSDHKDSDTDDSEENQKVSYIIIVEAFQFFHLFHICSTPCRCLENLPPSPIPAVNLSIQYHLKSTLLSW